MVTGTLPAGITASLVGNELTLSGTASVAATWPRSARSRSTIQAKRRTRETASSW